MGRYRYDGGGHCPECDGTGDSHYPGCTYDGTGSGGYRSSGGGMSAKGGVFLLMIALIWMLIEMITS